MALPELDIFLEHVFALYHARLAAHAIGIPLALVDAADGSGIRGQSWGSFTLAWDAELRAAGDAAGQLLRVVHRFSRLSWEALHPPSES